MRRDDFGDRWAPAGSAAAEIAGRTGVAQHSIAVTLGSGWNATAVKPATRPWDGSGSGLDEVAAR